MIKRVTIGFLSIVALLFFAGMISLFELGHLSNDAESLMHQSRESMTSAKEMLDALNDHSIAVSHIALQGRSRHYDTLCRNSFLRLESTLHSAAEHSGNNATLDSLAISVSELNTLTEIFMAGLQAEEEDIAEFSLSSDTFADMEINVTSELVWYDTRYDALRVKISEQINEYITQALNGLTPQTEQLSRNAYRAVTPVLIALLVMIAIVLMLFYFIMIYCVRPIIGINKGLANYLSFRQPFAVKEQCRDEILDLRNNVDTLIQNHEKHLM